MDTIQDLNNLSNKIIEMIPEITYAGNTILRQKTKEVSFEEGMEMGKKMCDVLKRYRDITGVGRGLAAPQIGSNGSVFITYIENIFKIYINPQIVSFSEKKNIYKENCISSFHIWCDVVRPLSITISYTNEQNELVTDECSSFLARLIQHEYDHLLGVLNIDKAEQGTLEFKLGDPLKEVLREID